MPVVILLLLKKKGKKEYSLNGIRETLVTHSTSLTSECNLLQNHQIPRKKGVDRKRNSSFK